MLKRKEPAPFKGTLSKLCVDLAPDELRELAQEYSKENFNIIAKKIIFVAADKESGTVYF